MSPNAGVLDGRGQVLKDGPITKSLLSKMPGTAELDMVTQIRRDKRYRSLGWVGVLTGIALFVVTRVATASHDPSKGLLESLPEVLPLALVAGSVLLLGWVRLWIRESNEPFKYTFSIEDFELVSPTVPDGDPSPSEPLTWLKRDLTEKLSERVQRLSLRDDEHVPVAKEDEPPASHVHISGWCGFRHDKRWELEVVPKVRLGGKGAPAKLAKTVRFKLSPAASGDDPPEISAQDYRMMFERVYWSVASQIYAQIRHGVAEKVKLLPRGRLRAAAYIREADDYAASNTLDAYEAARRLYHQAQQFYDLSSRPEAAGRWRRGLSEFFAWIDRGRHSFRRGRSWIWPRSGRAEVMTARAELGFARMLIAQWQLKVVCGMVPSEMYGASKIVDRAVHRLTKLSGDVSGQPEALFRAHVTQATARFFQRDYPGARDSLQRAQELRPVGSRQDAGFLFASGLVEPTRLRALRLLGRAVELEPMMEMAHFLHAVAYETIWRGRDDLEPEIAAVIDAEYEEVIALNPGNLSAWASRGYIGWLLADRKAAAEAADPKAAAEMADAWRCRAVDALETGRQYKEVRREATIGELSWNLTRLAAETGDFTAAYGHYIEAVSATLMMPQLEFEAHFYESVNPALVQRFKNYEKTVREEAKKAQAAGKVEKRLIKSVTAFVLNDCGLVYQSHYQRSGSDEYLRRAETAFEAARRANPDFVLAAYNLAQLQLMMAELPSGASRGGFKALTESAIDLLEPALRREPDWPQARRLLVEARSQLLSVLDTEMTELSRSGEEPATGLERDFSGRATASQPLLELEGRYARLNGATEEDLARLLPHECFRGPDGEVKLDVGGRSIGKLVKDRSVQWTRDFDMLHVDALIAWAKVVAVSAVSNADLLCQKLREEYYRADFELLDLHLRIDRWLLEQGGEKAEGRRLERLVRTVEEGQELLDTRVQAALEGDPIHLEVLFWTQMLEPTKRRQALTRALEERPGPTTRAWLLEQLLELAWHLSSSDERGEAIEILERVSREPGPRAGAARLRLAAALAETDRWEEALAIYRRMLKADEDPGLAAEATVGATRLLSAHDRAEEAKEIRERAIANPTVAVAVAASDPDTAAEIYRDLLTRDDVPEEVRAQSHLALGRLPTKGDPEAAHEHLLAASESAAGQARWDATIFLAQAGSGSDPEGAEALYRQVLDEGDDSAALVAAVDLSALLRNRGERVEANIVLSQAAATRPGIADRIEEWRHSAGL
jgi:tetratricopeptide (TPR) repeat protein